MLSRSALVAATLLTVGATACSERADTTPSVDASIGFDSGPTPDSGADPGAAAMIYACSATSLYRFDPRLRTLTRVADFRLVGQPPGSAPPITELAIDGDGTLLAASASALYDVDAPSAVLTPRAPLTGLTAPLVGLTFARGPGTERPLLALLANDTFAMVDPATGVATFAGALPMGVRASGDVLALDERGVFATTFDPAGGSDHVTELGATLTTATPIGAGTGYYDVLGLGYFGGSFFGFTAAGAVVEIEASRGTGTLVAREPTGPRFEGAAVLPTAPSTR